MVDGGEKCEGWNRLDQSRFLVSLSRRWRERKPLSARVSQLGGTLARSSLLPGLFDSRKVGEALQLQILLIDVCTSIHLGRTI